MKTKNLFYTIIEIIREEGGALYIGEIMALAYGYKPWQIEEAVTTGLLTGVITKWQRSESGTLLRLNEKKLGEKAWEL
jgi:hypothetical protein